MDETFEYKDPTSLQQVYLEESRRRFNAIKKLADQIPSGREKAVAMTHLETAAMWLNKAITHGPAIESEPGS